MILAFFANEAAAESAVNNIARIGQELDGSKAAVGILAKPNETAGVSAKLAELDGKSETHGVSDEALDQAQTATETVPQ